MPGPQEWCGPGRIMRIDCREEGSILRVDLSGGDVLDGRSIGTLRREVEERLAGRDGVILSLEGIHEIDSAGLGGLVALLSAVRRPGARLVLVDVAERPLSLMRMTRLTSVLEIARDESAAREALLSDRALA